MAVALVSSAHSENAASATSIGQSKAITSGNLVVCAVTVTNTTTITNVTDGTTTNTAPDVSVNWGPGSQRLALFSFPNHAGVTSVFTANYGAAATFREIDVIELSGAHLTAPFQASSTSTGSSAAPSSGTISPTPEVNGEYLIGYALGATAITKGGPFTEIVNDPTITASDAEGFAIATPVASAATWTMASGIWAAIAAAYRPSGPQGPLTFFCNNPVQGGSLAGLLDTAAPTASTSTTGWTVGTTVAARQSRLSYNNKVAATNFTATAQPSGAPTNTAQDSYRISGATTGVFSAGTWYSSLSVMAVTSNSSTGAAIFRLWRSANPDGTVATEITASRMTGATTAVTPLSTTVAQSSSASTQIASFSLNNEFLFMECGWATVTASVNAGSDVLVRIGPGMSTTQGSGIVTSFFSATGGAGGAAVLSPFYYDMMQNWFAGI